MRAVYDLIGEVIGAIGAPDFVAATADSLRRFAGFDLAAIVLHPDRGCPHVLYDDFDRIGRRAAVETYARVTHRINPMLALSGVVRARDFAGTPVERIAALRPWLVPAPEEELGFRTAGWPERQEELGLHLRGWDGTIEVGLYRERGQRPAPAATLRALAAMVMPIAAAFDRHRALAGEDRSVAASRRIRLSPRENDVCDLMLIGCSSDAIALRLGISRYTVKDHRKQIFRKLGIASLAELFASVH
ncbi:MAG: LuxR C-terminal-related transcriptional regulator [Sphingomonas sp.]|uniref:LuxR C-terminal-related transcriptional regulator n=1 Tax=Sphingomonas sp. TaxID=28214 RepID=UPI003F7FA7CD